MRLQETGRKIKGGGVASRGAGNRGIPERWRHQRERKKASRLYNGPINPPCPSSAKGRGKDKQTEKKKTQDNDTNWGGFWKESINGEQNENFRKCGSYKL